MSNNSYWLKSIIDCGLSVPFISMDTGISTRTLEAIIEGNDSVLDIEQFTNLLSLWCRAKYFKDTVCRVH